MIIYNSYIDRIRTIALSNKYTNTYLALIQKALTRQYALPNQAPYNIRKTLKAALGSTEQHHILPRSFKLGGEADSKNLVFLSSREHFVAHRLLTKMFTSRFKTKMYCAMHRLMHNHTNRTVIAVNSRIRIKINQTAAKAKQGAGNGMYGRTHSDETKALIGIAHAGKVISEECRELMRQNSVGENNNMYGKSHTEASLEKMRISQAKVDRDKENNPFWGCEHTDKTKDLISQARQKYNVENKKTCPHCSKSFDPTNYKRWHGDNCKLAPPVK